MIESKTHHAYLNNIVTISSDTNEKVAINDTTTGKNYEFVGSIDIHLSAGEHAFNDGNEHIVTVIIKDAIKIDGSKIMPKDCLINGLL